MACIFVRAVCSKTVIAFGFLLSCVLRCSGTLFYMLPRQIITYIFEPYPSTTGNITEKINQMGRIISRPQRSADEKKCKGHIEVGCEIENSSLTYERSVQVSETNGEEFLLESSGIYFQVVGSSAQLESSSW